MRTVKLLFVMLALLAAGGAVQAQKASYSGVEYKGTQFESKVWCRSEGNKELMRKESVVDGKERISICRSDSMAIYTYYVGENKGEVIPIEGVKDFISVSTREKKGGTRTSDKKVIGTEIIEGYECVHYYTTITTTFPNGTTETGCVDEWIYEPLGITMQTKAVCGFDTPITLKNLQIGEQPAQLFEIPKDIKFSNLFGNLKEMENMMNSLEDLFGGMKSLTK